MTISAVRDRFQLYLLIVTICAWSVLTTGCNDPTPSQSQLQTPQAVLDQLTRAYKLVEVDSSALADSLFHQALSAWSRGIPSTPSDSMAINCLIAENYFGRMMQDSARLYNDLAFESMIRNPETPDSLRTWILSGKGYFLLEEGRDDTASVLLRQALQIGLAQQPCDYEAMCEVLLNLGGIESDRGNFQAAAERYSQIVNICDHPFNDVEAYLENALQSLGSVLVRMGEYERAESLWVHTIQQREKTHGPRHELTASALHELSFVLTAAGRQYESIDYSRRAIDIFESLPLEERTQLPYAYHTLANTYRTFGLYQLAEDLTRKEAALDSLLSGPNSAEMCYPLMGLADLRRAQCRFDEAEAIYKQVLEKAWAAWGPENERLGDVYWSLVYLYVATMRPREAELALDSVYSAYYRRGRSGNTQSIPLQRDRARVAAMLGRHKEAESLIHEAETQLRREAVPKYYTLRSVLRAGTEIFRRSHQYDSSLAYFERLLAIEREFAERSFPYLNQTQRLQWLNASPPVQSGLVSMALQVNQPRFLRTSFQMAINAKARAIEAALAERQIALCSAEQEARPILDQYLRVSGQLANLSYMQMTQSDPKVQAAKIRSLAEERDSLELSLSQTCFRAGGALRQPEVTASAVFGRLRGGALLWDIVRYCPSADDAPYVGTTCTCDDHYAVFVCDAGGVRALHDIGRVAEIDSMVLALRSAVTEEAQYVYSSLASRSEAKVRSIAAQLTRRLPTLPVRDSSSPGTLYVSPDGALGLLPLELLTLDSTHYLIDAYRIGYLASSRDLVNDSITGPNSGQAIIVASPAYDLPGESAGNAPAEPAEVASSLQILDENLAACFGNGFVPLPQSGKEAKRIAALLGENKVPAAVRTGRQASEGFVRSLNIGPRIIHFATHGFFCDQSETGDLTRLSSPMLRSGLALAGANLTLRGAKETSQDDGILTAYEISAMDFSGTELVVLSACETGAGDVSRSDGVLGLTRAFRQAGARSVIMNLFDVPDKVADEVTTEFYRRWIGGESKADALRGAILLAKDRARSRFGHSHPYMWCGFILVGSSR